MFYVYVLEDESGEHYIGSTIDLRKRLKEHNQGRSFATKGHQWHCIYYEASLEESDARRREKYFKTTQGRRLLKRRVKDYLYKRRAS